MKRGFTKAEALSYLGVGRRFFDTHLMPYLKDKGVKAGTAVIFERSDLDSAWDRYKLLAGNERNNVGGTTQCRVQQSTQVFTRKAAGHTKSMRTTKSSAFEAVVLNLCEKRKST